jgi:aspartate racemase
MKTIGLIGGMSWQSTIDYYRIINNEVNKRLGGIHSARIVLYSVNFEEIMEMHRNKPEEMINYIIQICMKIEKSGAELLLLCSNTVHFFAEKIIENISIPLLHIIDATLLKINEYGITRIGLLGTRITMEQDFYRNYLTKRGIDTLIPEESEREYIESLIFNELFFGVIRNESKLKMLDIIHNLTEKGAEGVILGCTELPLLIKQEDLKCPVFDTTNIHAMNAVDMALQI